MGIVSRAVDRIRPPSLELSAAREAYVTLWQHGQIEQAAGIDHETDASLTLSGLVHEALGTVPRNERWRAVGGAYDLWGANKKTEI